MPAPGYIYALLFSVILSCGSLIEPSTVDWQGSRGRSADLLTIAFGDARKLFASHFFVKADVYFHSGYYPGIFDGKKLHERPHMAGQDAHEEHDEHEDHKEHEEEEDHETGEDYLGAPRDWIDKFGRNFFVTRHTHLPEGKQREMLPWLRLAASMDPHQVENYTVAAFWLRTKLNKADQAEEFLREGWRNNPDSPEILFELGQLLLENRKDPTRARNILELALRLWARQDADGRRPDPFVAAEILARLVKLETDAKNWGVVLKHLQRMLQFSPNPAAIQLQIDHLKAEHNVP